MNNNRRTEMIDCMALILEIASWRGWLRLRYGFVKKGVKASFRVAGHLSRSARVASSLSFLFQL